jgi:hypothetical protein
MLPAKYTLALAPPELRAAELCSTLAVLLRPVETLNWRVPLVMQALELQSYFQRLAVSLKAAMW